jgi:tetratricopeptide (TPR) repeat protein
VSPTRFGASRLALCGLLLGSGSGLASADDACTGARPALQAADDALDRGDWPEASRRLAAIEGPHGGCAAVVLRRARVRAAQGHGAEAERLFERAASLAPDDAEVHAHFARYWLARGQVAHADYQSSLALSIDPDCTEALVVSGQILALKGRPREADEVLARAARLDPRNAEAPYQWGVSLFRTQRHAEAAYQFERATALRPADPRILDYLALAYEAVGEGEKAEAAFGKAIQANQEGPFFDRYLDYNYGRFLLKRRRLEESRSHLDRALALLPRSRGVHYERGRLFLLQGDYPRARQEAEQARDLHDPGSSVLDLQVYYLLATVYGRLGEKALAEKYAELARTTTVPGQD